MPREPKAWFNKQTGWWSTDIAGKRHKLVPGKRGDARRKTPTQEATDALSKLLGECALNPTVEAGPAVQTVPSVIDEYLETGCRDNEVRTFTEKKALLNRFARRYRDKRAVDLIPLDLERWLREHPEWKSDDYRAKVCTTVHACFNWAASRGLLGTNARNPMASFSVTGGNRRRPMTGQEFRRIWGESRKGRKTGLYQTAGRRLRECLYFIKLTGARPKELRDLTWLDIDVSAGVARLKRHKTAKKTRKDRVIPLTAPVAALLRHLAKRDGAQGHVFKTTLGGAWARNSLAQKIKRLRDRTGVPDGATLYGLRHRFGTRAIMNGVDLKILAELLGHTTTRTTEHYVHTAKEYDHLRHAMARVNQARGGGRDGRE
jgi:integrase/recombinase XerD